MIASTPAVTRTDEGVLCVDKVSCRDVFCGSGRDTVYADARDFVANDCERVLRR